MKLFEIFDTKIQDRKLNKKLLKNKQLQWIKPDIDEEMPEIDRTVNHFKINKNQLLMAIDDAKLVNLTDNIWSRLDNTDSYEMVTLGNLNIAKKLAKKYNRDINNIIKAFDESGSLPAPIVLSNGKYFYLIAGNTRLMVARAFGITPKVLMVINN